jgi:hypothetical protein
MTEKTFGVVTSVQPPTWSVLSLAASLNQLEGKLIVVGDQKGPPYFEVAGVDFLSLEQQLRLDWSLSRVLPTGHYARKNIGYLEAIRNGATRIYETDDDNAPLQNWHLRREAITAHAIEETGWVNVYRLFCEEKIWPRGFPLDALIESFRKLPRVSEQASAVRAPIQQGLVNNSPDVDAIWRLIMDHALDFHSAPSVALPRGAWCPFNSQSTWWFPTAYPLMYLPSFCSFRMTDIWRSFIAQRCLWELGTGIVFHAADVTQERNAHDLMRDFRDEMPGYTRNRELAAMLEELSLTEGDEAVGENLLKCYEALVAASYFPREEFSLVETWLGDLETVLPRPETTTADVCG